MAKSRLALRAVAVLALFAAAPLLRGPATQPDPAAFDAVLAERARDGGFDYRGATGQDRSASGPICRTSATPTPRA